MHRKTISLMSGVALACVAQPCLAQAAAARDAPPQAPQVQSSQAPISTAQGAPSSPAAAPSTAISEIVVTANKRTERLQDVPVAVTVVDGSQLTRQNINQVSDLTRSAPALNTSGPFGALSIRGIGSVGFSRSSEGSVGVVIDNVALAGASTNPPELFDVSRVEVLEGPQGTLFGRNSSAGVINIVTNAPDPSAFEAIAHVDLGSRANYVARGVVNIPVSSDAALRISGSFSQDPEVGYNRYNDSWDHPQEGSGRVRFLWEPTSDLTINLIADYTQNHVGGGVPWSLYFTTPGSPFATRLAACGVSIRGDNDDGCINDGNDNTVQTYGASSQIDYHLGDYTLTSVTAYRVVNSAVPAYDVDSLPVYRLTQTGPFNSDNVSQEFRLTSPTGGFVDYVLGLYYFDSVYHGTVTQQGPLLTDLGVPIDLGQSLQTSSSTVNYAAFGQGTVHLTSKLRLILGARYDNEDVKAKTIGTLAPGAVFPVQSIAGVDASVSDNAFSYKGGVQYDLSRNLMAYGTYTQGYKGPAINDQGGGPGVPVLVRPEIPHAAEIGMKSTLFGGRLAADADVFYTKVDDFQAQYFDPTISQFVFGNAPSLTSKGVEVNLIGRPMPGLTINAGATYDDAKYGHGYVVSCAQKQTAAQGCLPVVSASGMVTGSGADANGVQLVGAPEWKATLSGQYISQPVFNAWRGVAQVDVVYTSRVYWDAAYDPLDTNAPAAIVGGRLGLTSQDQRYSVALFVRNLFDTYRPEVRFQTPTAAEEGDPQSYAQISGPESRRVVGLSLDAKF